MRKKYRISLIIILSLFFLIFLVASYYGPRMIIEVNNDIYAGFMDYDPDKLPQPADYSLNGEEINYKSFDGYNINGYIIRTDSSRQKGTIIILHGIRAYKEQFFGTCKMLADNGYNSVIIDLRAHGKSEGEYCTFGYSEKYDVKNLIDLLESRDDLSDNYGIWGNSLGGAIALQTMAIDERIKFGIIGSTFSDLETIVQDYAEDTFGFRIPVLVDYFLWESEIMADFDCDEVKPSESAKLIKQPVLIVHGDKDERISIDYGRMNYLNIASEEKEFYTVKGAGHLNLWEVGGDDYKNKIFEFLRKQAE